MPSELANGILCILRRTVAWPRQCSLPFELKCKESDQQLSKEVAAKEVLCDLLLHHGWLQEGLQLPKPGLKLNWRVCDDGELVQVRVDGNPDRVQAYHKLRCVQDPQFWDDFGSIVRENGSRYIAAGHPASCTQTSAVAAASSSLDFKRLHPQSRSQSATSAWRRTGRSPEQQSDEAAVL